VINYPFYGMKLAIYREDERSSTALGGDKIMINKFQRVKLLMIGLKVFLKMFTVIAGIEFVIMLVMAWKSSSALMSSTMMIVLDTLILSVTASLVIFYWIVLPLLKKSAGAEQEEKFIKNVFENITEGLVVIDNEYKIVFANKAYCSQVNMDAEEIVGRHCYEVSHHRNKPCYETGEECAIAKTLNTGNPHTVIHTHYDREGKPIYVETKSHLMNESSGKTMLVIETLNNITKERGLEEQLRHAQKMEIVGRFAGGIVHDFNNILTAIEGYANLVQMRLNQNDPLRQDMEQILASSERASNLIQGLLTFSRRQIVSIRQADLNGIIKKIEGILSRVIGSDIELRVMLTEKDLTALADSGQIEQVLLNLATNARDAMPEGGVLTISTESIESGSEDNHGKQGMSAVVSVTDTGTGMDEKTRERLFEPFFTTKEVGKGTGLGLSIVHEIIKQHKGHINVFSEPGKGTTFKIYLPVINTEALKIQTDSGVLIDK
jgi:PAS domain S-box-containing protein